MKNQIKTRKIFPIMLLLVMVLSVIVPETYHSQINRLPATPQMVALQFPLSPNFSASISSVVYGTFDLAATSTTGTILSSTANQRIYITQAKCVAGGSTDTVISVTDSTNTVLFYLGCQESKVAGETIYFNPPLRTASGSAVGVTAGTVGAGPKISMSGYKALN